MKRLALALEDEKREFGKKGLFNVGIGLVLTDKQVDGVLRRMPGICRWY